MILALFVAAALVLGGSDDSFIEDLQVAPATTATAIQPAERIVEIRVQGNYRTAEADILRLAAIQVGDTLAPDAIDAVRARLEKSGKFDDVQVLKRWRTIDSTEDVVLVIIVREAFGGTTNPIGRAAHALTHPLVLPVLDYTDGYGLTFGGRLSPVNLFGQATHVSIPLTWGSAREAALEVDRSFSGGLVTRVTGAGGIRQQKNPFYEANDRRLSLTGRAEHSYRHALKAGFFGTVSDVTFDPTDDAALPFDASEGGTLGDWGADIALDTRPNVDLPRNAVLLKFSWDHLLFGDEGINRYQTDLRGFIGLPLASTVVLHGMQGGATSTLPGFEQFLLGGEGSVRGFRAGYDAGDNLVLGSAEWRVPFTSPLSFGRVGAALFVDSGATYDHGDALGNVKLKTGVGTGLFLNAAFFNVKLDVARGLDHGWHFHAMGGLTF